MNRNNLSAATNKLRHFVGDDPVLMFKEWAYEEGWRQIDDVGSDEIRQDLRWMMTMVSGGLENTQRTDRDQNREALRQLYCLLEPERSVTAEGFKGLLATLNIMRPETKKAIKQWTSTEKQLFGVVLSQYFWIHSRESFQQGGRRRSSTRLEDKFILAIPLSEMRNLERQYYPPKKQVAADAALKRAWDKLVPKMIKVPKWWCFAIWQFLTWCEPSGGWAAFRERLK